MQNRNSPSGLAAVLVAATLYNLPFGTIYAFSVFLKPMESLLSLTRAQMTLVFALATISVTVGMIVAPRLYRSLAPAPILIVAGLTSAAGLLLTAQAEGMAHFALGYGLLFGLGGGVGFIVMQQATNQIATRMSGLINGYIVSLYPLGAMLGAPLFGWGIAAYGLRASFTALALTVAIAALASAILIARAKLRMHGAPIGTDAAPPGDAALFRRLFMVFFLAAAAGLTVMSQAAGIVQAYGGATALALGGTTFITGAIAAARIGGGALVDRFSVARVACGAHIWSLAGAALIAVWPAPVAVVIALAMIGMGYGILSGLTAATIPRYWERNAYGRIASRMYIAWCVAALSLPVVAGWLFDRTQGYGAALTIAAALNLAGAVMGLGLPPAPKRP
ncbi:MAG: nitrate/nitrite transporter [Burkholderiales bacterium]